MKLEELKQYFELYASAKIILYAQEQLIKSAHELHEDYYILNKEKFDKEKREQEEIIQSILNKKINVFEDRIWVS